MEWGGDYRNALGLSITFCVWVYHLTWYKCCPHWDVVQWPWPGSIPQRSRSHKTFKGQSTNARVRAITYICIDELPSHFVQMLNSLRRCAYIQEYLVYRSNNLYFLFSHSLRVVVYNFGQVQCTSQVESKTKCSKEICLDVFQWTRYVVRTSALILHRLVHSYYTD